MTFCPRCGSELKEGEVFCTSCGTRVIAEQPMPQMPQYQQPMYYGAQPSNGMAIAGFILSFIFPLLGLIFSIVGYSKGKYLNNSGKGLALAGIIISAIFMVIGLIVSIILISEGSRSYYYYRY